MFEIKQTHFLKSFDAFVKMNVEYCKDPGGYNISYYNFIEEYRTYKFRSSRQSGHTTSSVYVLPKYYKNIMFIYDSVNMERCSSRMFKEMCKTNWAYKFRFFNNNIHFLNVYNFASDIIGKRLNLDCVCIDNASFYKKSDTVKNAISLLIRSNFINYKTFGLYFIG